MITIVYFAHDSSLYGSNRSLLNLIQGLAEAIKPILFLPDYGSICPVLDELKISYYIFDYRYNCASISLFSFYKFPLKMLVNSYKNKVALKKMLSFSAVQNVDLVHSNSSVISIGLSFSKAINAKHIWHIREFQDLDHNLYPLFGKRHLINLLKNSNKVVCISKCIASYFNVMKNSIIIYNGVRKASNVHYIENKQDYFLFTGVLKRSKGIAEAIKAFSRFSRSGNSNTTLLIAGVAPNFLYRTYLKLLVRLLGIKAKVTFLGFVKNVDDYMQNALAVLMCSRNEAMGRVTPEAMFSGCPVIGFNNMGTKEMINHKVNGYLYDNIADLTDLMHYVYDNQSCNGGIKEVILQAQEDAVNNYSEEAYALKILSLYKETISNK